MELAEVLCGHLARPDQAGDLVAITEQLAILVKAAEAAWPDVRLPPEVFVARLAHHCSGDEPVLDWLRRVRAADLYLATACATRVPNAIETFDRELLASVPAILARAGLRDIAADEIQQRVRERLFVGGCRITDYSGRGALSSWLQVVTLRIAIDLGRQQRVLPVDHGAELDDLRIAGSDPELSLIKERCRQPFKLALRAAVEGLTSEQRNLLKLHFVDGATLEQLATLFHVHRATVARRIAQARETIFEDVRRRLQAELGIDRGEFEALLVLIRSRLELSLSALLPSVTE